MLPTTKEKFELNTNQVVEQIVFVPTPTSMKQNVVEVDDKHVPSETLMSQNIRDELLSSTKNEISSISQTATYLETKDRNIYLSDDVEPPTVRDRDTSSPHEIAADDEKNDLMLGAKNDISQVDDKTVTQQTTDAVGVTTIAGLQKREDTETAMDVLVAELSQYKGTTKTMMKEFVREIIDMMKVWVQSSVVTLSNDPVMISITQYVKDAIRIIEISMKLVNDRLPSDSQPFVKGFLVGTLLLNVFNEGQKYKKEVYTMYSDEKANSRNVDNYTDVTTSEPQMINNDIDFAPAEEWIRDLQNIAPAEVWIRDFEHIAPGEGIRDFENIDALETLDDEKDTLVGEVQALAEVLISKRIVKELLQKKKEKKKPYFASSMIAITDQQNSPLPQPPMETPSIEFFDANVRALVVKSKWQTDGSNFPNLSDNTGEQLISSRDTSSHWTVPFLRNFANKSRDEKFVPVPANNAEKNTNAFILWMKKIATSLTFTEKVLDETSEVPSFISPSQSQPNQFAYSKEDLQRDPLSKRQTNNIEDDFSAYYDFTSPSKVDEIFDYEEFSYEKGLAQDAVSGSAQDIGDFNEQENSSAAMSPNTDMGTESFRRFKMPPMQVNNERQRSEQLESKEGEKIAPFNIPVFNDSAKSGPQWPPPMKRTSYRSTGEDWKTESKSVEFNGPFDTYGYQYARNGGSISGNDSASAASAEPPSKFEFTPSVDYDGTFSALNIYSSAPSTDFESGKIDLKNVQPSNNYEYTEEPAISSNGTDESRKFEFPAPSTFEPTFSALSIYGDPSAESPPESSSNLENNFLTQEYVEPTFSAFSVYSVTPERNDVPRVSNPEKLYSSVDGLYVESSTESPPETSANLENNCLSQEYVEPTFTAFSVYSVAPESNDAPRISNPEKILRDPSEVLSNPIPITRNQENAFPETIDSKTSSVPTFSLADLFNETTTVQDAEKLFELQDAVSIPIADILPPSFEVDLEVADRLQTNPYDNVNMFSILPDMLDTFSAKSSYNPYPTQQPEKFEVNDLMKDAIDTPIDTNPIYQEKKDFLFVLPLVVSKSTHFNELRKADLPLSNQYAESAESRKSENEEVSELTMHVVDTGF